MKYIKREKKLAIMYLVLSLLNAFITSYLMVSVMDRACYTIEKRTLDDIKMIGLMILLFLSFSAVVLVLYVFVKNRFIYRVIADIREDIFASILSKEPKRFYENDVSDYLNIFTKKIDQVEKYYGAYFSLIIAVVALIGNIFFSLRKNVILTVIILCFSLMTTFIPIKLQKKLAEINNSYLEKWDDFLSVITGALENYKEIRIYKKLPYVTTHFSAENDEVRKSGERVSTAILNVNNAIMLMILAIQYLMIFICGILIFNNKISASYLLVAIVISGNVTGNIQDITEALTTIVATKTIYKQVMGFTEQYAANNINANLRFNKIVFSNASFGYEESKRKVLKRIDFEINDGDFVVLTGESGSGKSTFLKILLGEQSISGGKIVVNENIIEDSLKRYEDNFAVIFQETNVFQTSLYNNITLFQKIDENTVLEAAYNAGLGELIEKLPDGIHTVIREHGKNLSGGEKQRISIARALLSGRKKFILDEATSSLDRETALEIEHRIISIPDSTIIMITHRCYDEILEKCDAKYLIEDGIMYRQTIAV